MLMNTHIKIGKLELHQVESVKIESSWELLTDRAEIVLPRSIKFARKLDEYFLKGDKVEIYLGYNGELNKEFEGYITKISVDTPITVECEDRMYELKKIKVNKIFIGNLQKLISEIVPQNIVSDVADIELGGMVLQNTTVAKVMQELKDKFKIYSYFQNSKLIVGKIYTDDKKEVNYEIEKNVIKNGLNFKNKEDIEIMVVAKSYMPNGKVMEVKYGDEGAPETEMVFYNINNEKKLKELAIKDYERIKIDGFEGEIETFGVPYVEHGYIANIKSTMYSERNGRYFIDAVNTSFSSNGFRRNIKLGRRANV